MILRRIGTIICIASLALIVGGCQSIPPPAPHAQMAVVPERASYFPSDAELRELLQALVEQGQSKGIVLGIREPDGRRRIIVHGDAGADAPPLSAETVFEIGSITKTFTGAILADVVRRGEVSLDDPVAKFLPAGVRVPSRNGRQITLLDLAIHISGLPRSPPLRDKLPDRNDFYARFQVEHLYDFLSSHELERDIGTEWAYSNLGSGLLGHALGRAAGVETLDELIRQRIIVPLRMNRTGFGRANGLGAWMAQGHDPVGAVAPYWDFAVLAGAGGLNSNVGDMLTYIDANVGEPRSPIEAAMRDAHQPRHSLSLRGNSQALGWDHRVRSAGTIVHKGGSTAGFGAALGFDPATRAGVVILGNGPGFGSRVNVVLQLLRGGRPPFRTVSVPAPVIDPLLGRYVFDGGEWRFFRDDEGKLFTRLRGGQSMEVFATGDDRFFYGPGTLGWFAVQRDPAGRHVMSMYQAGLDEPATSVRAGPVPGD